jgi:energy-coupling factor transport system ATP-binding protein
MEIYRIEGLSFAYPSSGHQALDSIGLVVRQGDFIVLCGKSGCGKTTLLRHLKTVLTPHGTREGSILFRGEPLEGHGQRTQAQDIGFVSQIPDNQIVTDKVWHELAFGLEGLGVSSQAIRLRVAEMASFFGIEGWFMKDVGELSGGQKQLLNLASVMAMQPQVLILDEPTSQLDPIAASEFLETVRKINLELGVTVILTEHRLEEVFPLADAVIVMERGRIAFQGTPTQIGIDLKASGNDMAVALPSAMQIYGGVLAGEGAACPVTVRDGRRFLDMILPPHPNARSAQREDPCEKRTQRLPGAADPAIQLKEVWFRYSKEGADVLSALSLEVPQQTLFALMGGNGAGKTTALNVIAGIERPYRGKVLLRGRPLEKYRDQELWDGFLGVLPQNPQALFVKKTVELDLLHMLKGRGYSTGEQQERLAFVAGLVAIEHLFQAHPYDLSGGEQQRAALAKVLLLKPQILMLDEPTKGLDNHFKEKLAGILNQLIQTGVTVLMVSHDIEFCARYAHTCALMFGGSVIAQGPPQTFFGGNSFYTTAANRIARHRWPQAILTSSVIALCNEEIAKS